MGDTPVFVAVNCEQCGAFWRFEQGKAPLELSACPDCDETLEIDGVTFISGERGDMNLIACRGCGHRWSCFAVDVPGRGIISDCGRCNGATKNSFRWAPWKPKEEKEMARKKDNGAALDADRIEKDRYEEKLLCEVPDEEIKKKANDLALAIEERSQLKERRRAAVALFKDKLTGLDEKIQELGEGVRTKSDRRNVLCVEYLIDRQNKIIVVRQDTQELVSERAATPEDRQEEMFGAGERPKKRGRPKKEKTGDPAKGVQS